MASHVSGTGEDKLSTKQIRVVVTKQATIDVAEEDVMKFHEIAPELWKTLAPSARCRFAEAFVAKQEGVSLHLTYERAMRSWRRV